MEQSKTIKVKKIQANANFSKYDIKYILEMLYSIELFFS